MDVTAMARFTRETQRHRQVWPVADEEEACRHAATNAIEHRHDRVHALHRAEIRDVGHEADAIVAAGEPGPKAGHVDPTVHTAVEEVGDHLDVAANSQLGRGRGPQAR